MRQLFGHLLELFIYAWGHRRRIELEDKAKVVPTVWGTESRKMRKESYSLVSQLDEEKSPVA